MQNISLPAHTHSFEAEKVIEQLGSNASLGLDSAEHQTRLKVYGFNALPRQASDGALKVFLRQFHNPLVYVLLGSSALALFMGKVTDSSFYAWSSSIQSSVSFKSIEPVRLWKRCLRWFRNERKLCARVNVKKSTPES